MTQTLLLIFALFSACMMAISLYWNNLSTKFVSITLFVILANCVYFSLDSVKGWPAEEPKEVVGTLASVVVVNPSDSQPGAIYIGVFLTELPKWYQYTYPRNAPKTFYVKYSSDRAAKFEEAKQAMQEGKEVRINGIPPENSSDGSPAEGNNLIEDAANMITDMLSRILSNTKDTYKPEVPDVVIVSPELPPKKGTSQ